MQAKSQGPGAGGASSVLLSSSKYLNHAPLRDYVASAYLRRNGPDHPLPADNIDLKNALEGLRDDAHVEALFEREMQINPVFERWMKERFISTFQLEDLAGYGPETLAGAFHQVMSTYGFDYNLDANFHPKTHFQFWRARVLQCHDWNHILCGAQFNSVGENLVYWAILSNFHRFLSPELAGELQIKAALGGLRLITRTALHYPGAWLKTTEAIEAGIRIGRLSDCMFSLKMEDCFHLPLDEARKALGIRGVEGVLDTVEASEIFDEGQFLAQAAE